MHAQSLGRRLGPLFALVSVACAAGGETTSTPTPSPVEGAADAGPGCTKGETYCDGQVLRSCDATGTSSVVSVCPAVCVDGLGCVACEPGAHSCDGNDVRVCNDDGSGTTVEPCDAAQGLHCNPERGVCEGACAGLGTSYIGCEYYPTVSGNLVSNDYHFAVAVANTTMTEAQVTVDGAALAAPLTLTVPAGSVKVQTLPWQLDLKLVTGNNQELNGRPAPGGLAPNGAFRLRSTVPVTVYQFNPLEYAISGAGEGHSFTNDASLLFPTNVWHGDYYVAAWQDINGTNPTELAITAQQDGTMVTVTSRAATEATDSAPAFAIGVPTTVQLDRGAVLQLTSRDGDFTGTHVVADKPVQVLGAHFCAKIPEFVAYCDHLEESMIAVESLGRRYVVNAPAVPTLPNGKVQVVRIVATAPDTHVTYTPSQGDAPTVLANAGDFLEIQDSKASFVVEADKKVLVAQYMEGQLAGGNTGDPAMALAVPVEQFRNEYLFHAPTNYETNYVDVTAPVGASVQLDGSALSFTPIAGTDWALSRNELAGGPAGDGNHAIRSDVPFGITVYGYGEYTSYWYPGGLDLRVVVE